MILEDTKLPGSVKLPGDIKSNLFIKGNVNLRSKYPACVQSFGDPVRDNNNVWYIAGKDDYAGQIYFYNYKFVDKDGYLKTYRCNDDNQPETVEEQKPVKTEPVKTGNKDPYDINSYPKCVQFGTLTKTTNGQVSINGMGDFEGYYFYNNGRFVDIKNNTKGTYSCSPDGLPIPIPGAQTSNQTSVKPPDKTEPVKTGDRVNTRKFNRTNITGGDITNGKVVQRYMFGDIVGQIQNLLITASKTIPNPDLANISTNGNVDNYFGNRTESAVKLYQKLKGLTSDGKVGPKTWYFLNKESTPVTPSTGGTPTTPINNTTQDTTIPNYPTNPQKVEFDPNKRVDNFGRTYHYENGQLIQDISETLNESIQVIKIKNLIKKII